LPDGPFLNNLKGSFVLEPRDEVNRLLSELNEPLVVDVAPIHNEHAARIETHLAGDLYVAGLPSVITANDGR